MTDCVTNRRLKEVLIIKVCSTLSRALCPLIMMDIIDQLLRWVITVINGY